MILLCCARVPALLPARAEPWLLCQLSPQDAQTLRRRLATGGGQDSATGLALLAHCGRVMNLPPLSAILRPDGGKPHWPGGPDFSITHARGFAACAVAPPGLAIGIDLEPAGRVRPQSIRRVLTAAEERALDAGLDATRLWTAKEAVLKAAGASLADAGSVEIDGQGGRIGERHFHLQHLTLDGGAVLTLATSEPLAESEAQWVAEEALFAPEAAS